MRTKVNEYFTLNIFSSENSYLFSVVYNELDLYNELDYM